MNLIKWNPWREMDTFSDRASRIFGSSFFPTEWLSEESGLRDWTPAVDVFENEENIIIKAELPGVEKKDIHVDVKDGVLSITGERTYENEVKEEKYHRKERAFGRFHRSFALPEGLDPEKIDADYKDGVLKVEIPKPEEKKPKKIAVH
jgi:HSP20 family protein